MRAAGCSREHAEPRASAARSPCSPRPAARAARAASHGAATRLLRERQLLGVAPLHHKAPGDLPAVSRWGGRWERASQRASALQAKLAERPSGAHTKASGGQRSPGCEARRTRRTVVRKEDQPS